MSEKANLFAIFPNRRLTSACPKLSKRAQSAKQKNDVFGFAYAECRRTYVKLVQGMFAIFPNRRQTYVKLSKNERR